MSDAVNEFNEILRTQKTISISRLIKLRRAMGVVNSRKVEKLEQQNRHYREVLENIKSVKYDEDFNPYEYMILEIIEWAEKALEESE